MLGVSTPAMIKFQRVIAKAKQMTEKRQEAIGTVVRTSEVSAAAFALGLVKGKFGATPIPGVKFPIDLLAGLGLHLVAFTKYAGRHANHLHAFGDGALASFLHTMGHDYGVSLRSPADQARIDAQRTGMKGDLGLTGGASLADEELARMVAAGRR